MRDVEYSLDGGYLATATTGGPYLNTLCDTISRWDSDKTGSGLLETWSDWSGGDTLTAVAITDKAIYIGGHQRWMNNHTGRDSAGIGAVSREGIGALDPINGVPLAWNPGKDRGVAVYDLHASADSLYVGSDTDFTAGEYHPKLAMFPVAGGTTVPEPTPESLPSNLYTARSDDSMTSRPYDGTTFGSATTLTDPIDWAGVGGGFHEAGKVYFVESSALRSRTYDGANWGASVNEPSWTIVDQRLGSRLAQRSDVLHDSRRYRPALSLFLARERTRRQPDFHGEWWYQLELRERYRLRR